jgi:adhesin transport system membrane fusion protein
MNKPVPPQKKQAQPPAKEAAAKDLNLNKDEDWATLQKQWMQERVQKAEAYADRYFMTDDELPLKTHMLLLVVFSFFVVFVLWASFATLDETARGEGQIIPTSEIQVIQNLEGGIVDQFFVTEGSTVKKDQPIMRLRDVGANSEFGSNQARYLGLMAAIIRLQAEVEGKSTVEFTEEIQKGAPKSVVEELAAFRANQDKIGNQVRVLQEQLSQRKQEVSELTTRLRDLESVIRLSREEKSMIEPLVARGSAPKIELVQLERGIREKQTELNGVREAIPRANAAIAEAQARITEMKTTRTAEAQAELAAKTAEMSAVKEMLGALEDRKDRTEIRSPVNGTIKDFKINTVGGVVKPGDPIVEIVPIDEQLLVEAKIRPSDIARLRPNMPAMVKITAYDFTIYGGLKGEVADISADTIKNEKGESFYRVKVRTFESSLKRKGEVLPIIPGMIATVDIQTGHKTVMEYLLKPFVKTMQNSMNEK